ILEKYDKNKDGKLDDDEKAAMEKARQERRAKLQNRMLKKYDKNKDGKLDDDEKASMRKERRERRDMILRANSEAKKKTSL
ncbi:MAG: hypothetical protein V1746_01790, partial [bacterium]